MTTADLAFLKDLGDMVRARTIFFFPFFGAFLAFLFAKSQYLIEAGIVIQFEMFTTFFLGVTYAYIVSKFLYNIESCRMMLGLKLSQSIGAGLVFTLFPSVGTSQALPRSASPLEMET